MMNMERQIQQQIYIYIIWIYSYLHTNVPFHLKESTIQSLKSHGCSFNQDENFPALS